MSSRIWRCSFGSQHVQTASKSKMTSRNILDCVLLYPESSSVNPTTVGWWHMSNINQQWSFYIRSRLVLEYLSGIEHGQTIILPRMWKNMWKCYEHIVKSSLWSVLVFGPNILKWVSYERSQGICRGVVRHFSACVFFVKISQSQHSIIYAM